MKIYLAWLSLIISLFVIVQMPVRSQNADEQTCDEAGLEAFIVAGTSDLLTDNPDAATSFDLAYIYRVADLTTAFALACGYQPTFPEIEAQIDRTLDLVPLSFVIAASSIGNDVDIALEKLEGVQGDSFNGQLLYNGLEVGLDGSELGCAGCHNGEVAPITEASYTRADEQRLLLPEFADYTVTQYLVESILHPSAYIVPEYAAVQMPANYGSRLDAQQLADLIAYLDSQDQLLDE